MAYQEPFYSGMPNQEYWEERAKQSLAESFKTSDEVYNYLEEVYKKSLLDFCKDYNDLLKPFVRNGKLDTNALNSAIVNDISFQAKYNALYNNISSIGRELGEINNKEITEALKTVYADTITRTTGDFKTIYKLDKSAIERAVRTP